MELLGRLTVFAEGCRGSLTKTLFQRFNLRDGVDPQTYAIGIKELWEVDPDQFHRGRSSTRSAGPRTTAPMAAPSCTIGRTTRSRSGSSPAWTTPTRSRPFDELQRLKHHPAMRPIFEGGRRVSYGARALTEGGLQSVPKLVFPGGALIGDTAGFLNVPKIKGTHTAMKSAMLCAEAAVEALVAGDAQVLLRILPGCLPQLLAVQRIARRAQHPALIPQGPHGGARLLRDGYVRVPRQGAPGRCTIMPTTAPRNPRTSISRSRTPSPMAS